MLRSNQTGVPAGWFSVADVRHACRWAQRTSINVENEANFLIKLANHRKQSYEDIASDTVMTEKSYQYLLQTCGSDMVAVRGLKRIRELRQQVADNIRGRLKSLDGRSSRRHS